jgi:hypothetical protein
MNLVTREVGDTFLMIRTSYVAICNGNHVAAALIHIFEQWHIAKLKQREQDRKARPHNSGSVGVVLSEGLYQWHTTDELVHQLMGLAKKDTILTARRQLVSMGIISEHRNPNPKYGFDKTTYYIFHPEVVNSALELRAGDRTTESAGSMPENRHGVDENRQSTYITSIDNDIENDKDIPAADRGSGPDPVPKKKGGKKKTAGPADGEWQRWVDAWHNFVTARNGVAPLFNGAQLGALKALRKHLTSVATPIEGKTPDDTGFVAWEYILKNWDRLDDWLRSQLDLTVVLKKINDILNQLRNGSSNGTRQNNTGGAKSGTSAERVDAILNY